MADDDKVQTAKDRLGPFLEANQGATVEKIDSQEGDRLGIKRPWGEEGIVIYLPDDLGDLGNLTDALNELYLPDRFTAVWHRDTKDLEVIWTAYPLRESQKEVMGREFPFSYDSAEYQCEFAQSSDRVLLIAEHAEFVAMSPTNHRNLSSFKRYVEGQKESDPDFPKELLGVPTSFWIRNLEWDEDRVLRLVRHLNFYLSYYDRQSPEILVHPPELERAKPQTRYLVGDFPKRLDGREIEDDLLHLWAASRGGDAGRRFGYCYRIIEYASLSYVDDTARQQVRMLLSAPHAQGDVNALADQVISATLRSKTQDDQRMMLLLRGAVRPDLLWAGITRNIWAFAEEIQFEGGFTLQPLIKEEETPEEFAASGIMRFATSARQIRNHLSHGRDKATQASISPTIDNFRKLEPWAAVISVAAGEVINYKHII